MCCGAISGMAYSVLVCAVQTLNHRVSDDRSERKQTLSGYSITIVSCLSNRGRAGSEERTAMELIIAVFFIIILALVLEFIAGPQRDDEPSSWDLPF